MALDKTFPVMSPPSMMHAVVGLLVVALVAGCATPQHVATRPGATLRGNALPEVEPGPASSADMPPAPLKMKNPIYPHALRQQKIEGTVRLEFVVGTSGRVVSARAIESPHPELTAAALAAVDNWEFRPAMRAGKPIAVRLETPIQFILPARSDN